ncbi:MAG TPA: hypothetical protein DIU07_08285 [Rhodobacteraceae bacterium]|nr:hypothetical protein [Paracoccaceae bacterium]
MAKVFDLSALESDDGFTIKGDAPGDNAGWSVSGAGDVNGDGIADFIVGAPDGDDRGLSAGEAYVVFGRDVAGGAAAFGTIDLSDLDPADGFIIQGAGRNDLDYPDDIGSRTGVSVSGVGDVNGDGIDDLIVGAPDMELGYEQRGGAYLIFGRDVAGGAAAFGTIDVDTLDPADGIFFRGNVDYDLPYAFDREGYSVSGAGDVNGDGFADLIIGAPLGDRGGFGAGEAYVIYGGDLAAKAGSSGSIRLYSLSLSNGFIIRGDASRDAAAASVSDAGDVNGDGIADLIVGAPGGDDGGADAGEAYVVFGRDVSGGADAFTTIDLSDLDPADGFIIQGDASGDGAGSEVSAAGDVNGDGIADLIVGAYQGDDAGDNAGEAYVVFGRDVAGGADAFGTIDLSALAPSDGFIIQGDRKQDLAGSSVSSAGDVNGDGIDDLIVGAPGADKAYVVYGRDVAGGANPFGTVDLSNLGLDEGFTIDGDGLGVFAGISVSGVGDINGDGFDDIIVGAPGGDDRGRNAGEAYVIFGKPVPEIRGDGSANTLVGGPDDDILRGLGGADLLRGMQGNDLLRGGSGDDELRGGKGADVLYGNQGDDTLFGGLGNDLLHGRAGDDVLDGGEGRDSLKGGLGADRIDGGDDKDRIKGGLGQDYLVGGDHKDRFLYGSVDHSQAGAGDTIADFEAPDLIHLRRIDADTTSAATDEAFTWLADAAFTNTAGELRYEVSGANILVQGDVDGDGVADIEITILNAAVLTADDFVL